MSDFKLVIASLSKTSVPTLTSSDFIYSLSDFFWNFAIGSDTQMEIMQPKTLTGFGDYQVQSDPDFKSQYDP